MAAVNKVEALPFHTELDFGSLLKFFSKEPDPSRIATVVAPIPLEEAKELAYFNLLIQLRGWDSFDPYKLIQNGEYFIGFFFGRRLGSSIFEIDKFILGSAFRRFGFEGNILKQFLYDLSHNRGARKIRWHEPDESLKKRLTKQFGFKVKKKATRDDLLVLFKEFEGPESKAKAEDKLKEIALKRR